MSSWSSRGSEVGDQFVRSGRYLVNPPLEFGGYKVATPLTAYPPYHLRCGTPASREVSTPELEEGSRSGDSTYFVWSVQSVSFVSCRLGSGVGSKGNLIYQNVILQPPQ